MNIMPNGFEYHWPTKSFEEIDRLNNWFVNYETHQIFINATREVYKYELNEDLTIITFGFDGCQVTRMARTFDRAMREAYMTYAIQKELLE